MLSVSRGFWAHGSWGEGGCANKVPLTVHWQKKISYKFQDQEDSSKGWNILGWDIVASIPGIARLRQHCILALNC